MKIDKPILEIKLINLTFNYKIIEKLVGNSKVISVVKGDGYGHGMIECSKTLIQSGCNHFYVANLDDAISMRNKFKRISIYVLSGPINSKEVKILNKYKLVPIINNFDQLELINKNVTSKNQLKSVIQIDTGMNRMGIRYDSIEKIKKFSKNINLDFLMSHFTSADEKDKKNCDQQLEILKKINRTFNAKLSIANSAGCFLNSKYHLDYVRPGKSLYGMNPFFKESFKLKQVATLYAPIIQISYIKKGETVGYGKTFKVKKNTRTATISIGYANGYMRIASNSILTFINNFPAKVLGRISMDLITIDISKVPDRFIYLGQAVELLGKNATYENVSKSMKTNELETLIAIGAGNNKSYTK